MAAREPIEVWDDEAATFDEAADHGLRDPAVRAAWRDLLLGLLPAPPGHVADLGCGTGTLSLLLAAEGYAVDGVDFSRAMVQRARAKAAADPAGGHVGFVGRRCRRPTPDPRVLRRRAVPPRSLGDARSGVRRWVGGSTCSRPPACLVLVEGHWSTGAGLTAEETVALVEAAGRRAELRRLPEAAFWGREISDERYAVVSR